MAKNSRRLKKSVLHFLEVEEGHMVLSYSHNVEAGVVEEDIILEKLREINSQVIRKIILRTQIM